MIPVFYGSVFVVSMICAAIYVYIWHKHFDVNFTMIFTLVPIASLGYFIQANALSMEEYLRGSQVAYIGGCFLQLFVLLSIFNLCHIQIPKWVRTLMFSICGLVYLSVLSAGKSKFFYKRLSFDMVDGVPTIIKEYGFMHTLFYALVIIFFAIGIIAIIYSLCRKNQVPRTIIYLLVLPNVICVLSYLVGKITAAWLDPVPVGYVFAEIVYLLIAFRLNLYDINDTVIDSLIRDQEIGYISCDFKKRYLGSNEVARMLLPDLMNKAVDDMIEYKASERQLRHYIDEFCEDEQCHEFVYILHSKSGDPEEDRYYNANVGYLFDGNKKRGYIITFTDDTADKKYISLLDNYNEKLQEEVKDKTRHIVMMHDNLIMSLAMMVESRDNSTGGHIKRTSEGVRILMDEIIKEGSISLSPDFCRNVIKAAPMHDLGKIAVDDAVLRKPGRFTDEEYEKMKQHAPEGARVIHEILHNTDDEDFKIIAENVAHYHHERWDGSGYPEKIAGEQIPIEARIMAIADVYDALVSKRVYKEAFDFEKADRIIMEGMGTQFDPGLKTAYMNARPRLEAYYNSVQ